MRWPPARRPWSGCARPPTWSHHPPSWPHWRPRDCASWRRPLPPGRGRQLGSIDDRDGLPRRRRRARQPELGPRGGRARPPRRPHPPARARALGRARGDDAARGGLLPGGRRGRACGRPPGLAHGRGRSLRGPRRDPRPFAGRAGRPPPRRLSAAAPPRVACRRSHRALTRAIASPKVERGLIAPHHNDWRLFMTTSSRLALAAAILVALPAAAQADPMFGVRLGYYTKVGDPFIGAELLFRIVPDLYFNPNVEAVLVDNGRYLSLNDDFHDDI